MSGEAVEHPLVFLIEDNQDIVCINRQALLAAGYRVEDAATLGEARDMLPSLSPSLIILDIILPDGSGLALCREIRALAATPVLFLTSLGDSVQIVEGLRAGGDDYLTKPYDMSVFLARVEAQLRRWGMSREEVVGRLRLDIISQRAYYKDRDLLLKPKEFALLLTLLRGRDRYHQPEVLFAQVWGMDATEDVRTVQVHLSRLRRKLDEAGMYYQITYVLGRGYRLELAREGMG